VDEGSADGNLNVGGDGTGLIEGINKLGEGGDGTVALPVTTNEIHAFAFLGRVTRGRTGGPGKVQSTLYLLGNSLNLLGKSLHFAVL